MDKKKFKHLIDAMVESFDSDFSRKILRIKCIRMLNKSILSKLDEKFSEDSLYYTDGMLDMKYAIRLVEELF